MISEMKLGLFIVAVAMLFHPSKTLTYQEQSIAYLEFMSSAITDVLATTEVIVEDVEDVIVTLTPSQVKVYYYNKSSMDEYIASCTLADTSCFDGTFDPSKKSLYITHGFVNNYQSPVNVEVKAAVLGSYDVNCFVTDWPAYEDYVTAYNYVPYVGQYLGEFINNISTVYGYSNSQVTLVGHSLGAHISGKAGNVTNGTVGYIVGLDPAGPLYNLDDDPDTRLSDEDAGYVEVIHTNTDLYGIKFSVGHSDFYADGGATQPGCNPITDITSTCSHRRSYLIYAESVRSGGFDAFGCNIATSSDNISNCNLLDPAYVGEYALDTSAEGDYLFTTNAESPYAQGVTFNSTG